MQVGGIAKQYAYDIGESFATKLAWLVKQFSKVKREKISKNCFFFQVEFGSRLT